MVCNIGRLPWMFYSGYMPGNMYYRSPYMFSPIYNYSYNSYMNNYAAAAGAAAGERDILRISYSCLIENLNNFIIKASGAQSNTKLSQEELDKYNELKQKAEELLKRVQNYGMGSSNIAVLTAIDNVNAMRREYKLLYQEEAELAQKSSSRIASENSQNNSNTSATDNNTTNKPNSPDNTNPTDNNSVDNNQPVNPNSDDENLNQNDLPPDELTEVTDNYNGVLKPNIDTLVKSKHITSEDKNAIVDKQKAIENAIKSNKDTEQIKKLYDELNDLYNQVNERVELNKVADYYKTNIYPGIEEFLKNQDVNDVDKQNISAKQKEIEDAINQGLPAEQVQKLCTEFEELLDAVNDVSKINKSNREYKELNIKSTKLVSNISGYISNYKLYIAKQNKQKLREKISEIENAKLICAPKETIKKLYDELSELYTQIKTKTDKLVKESDDICQAIHNAADGFDFSIGESKNEKIIKQHVKKINKDNVIAVLNKWSEKYKFGSESMLETIEREFLCDGYTKSELKNHIMKVIKDYAKEIGVDEKISDYVDKINSVSMNSSEKYEAFNKIIKELNKTNE